MATDHKYFEAISMDNGQPDGRLSAIKMRDGHVHLCIEEWIEGRPDPVDAEVNSAVAILTAEQFRSFLRWGVKEVGV